MSDYYIYLGEKFEDWKNANSDMMNPSWSLEDMILAWADVKEIDLGNIDIDILCNMLKSW